MNILEKTYEMLDQQRDELLKCLGELIAIPSVAVKAEGEYPFGREVDRAFRYMLNEGEKAGFRTFDADHYGGHIQWNGTGSETLGIVGHLDVVPEGKDWDYPAFEMTEEEGKLFGRGTIDDKGPVAACFFAMKALKEAGFQPKRNIRLVLGLDEETNWEGMDYYLNKTEAPDFGFTPDGEFPAIHGEKGILVFDIAGKFSRSPEKGLRLRSIKGGNAANMVADYCRAVLLSEDRNDYEKVKEQVSAYRDANGYLIHVKQIGKSLEIITHGKSAHGARPWTGLNAISIMMEILEKLNFTNDDMNGFIQMYQKHIGFETDGESIGLGFSDEPSGKLVWNVGMIDLNGKGVTLTINVRYPVTLDDEKVYDALVPVMNQYNLGIIKGKHQLPIYLPRDSELISTMMEVYRKHTGDKDSQPLVIGGGTYARAMENVVAFGPSLPGDREVAHQKNEYVEKEHLFLISKLYVEVIYELTK